MDQNPQTNWRSMFERGRQDRPPGGGATQHPASPSPRQAASTPSFGYDDGYDPARHDAAPMPPQQVADEAAMALAEDIQEYRPWILQRGTRPLMMLNLRRFDAKAGHWMGWQVSYPHLIAVEYVGGKLLSLDFGTRHFVIEGTGLGELARHLQTGAVQAVVEYTPEAWVTPPEGAVIRAILCVTR